MKEGTKMLNPRKASTVFVTLIMVGLCFSFLPAKTMDTPLLPFSDTGDLFVLEGASESILRITPGGITSVLTRNPDFTMLNVFMTHDPNGDINLCIAKPSSNQFWADVSDFEQISNVLRVIE
jgi:hypothetical protein